MLANRIQASFASYPNEYNSNCPAYIEEVLKTLKALKKVSLNFIPKLYMLLHVPDFFESINAPLGNQGDQGGNNQFYSLFFENTEILYEENLFPPGPPVV